MGLFGGNKSNPMEIAERQRQREQREVEQAFLKGVTELRDFIAPSSIEIESGHFRLGTYYARSFYVYGYPRQIFTGWLSAVINMDEEIDLSMFV
jgi:hypothetical protein